MTYFGYIHCQSIVHSQKMYIFILFSLLENKNVGEGHEKIPSKEKHTPMIFFFY